MINNSEVHLKLQVHPHRLLLLPWQELMTRGNVNFCEDFFRENVLFIYLFFAVQVIHQIDQRLLKVCYM